VPELKASGWGEYTGLVSGLSLLVLQKIALWKGSNNRRTRELGLGGGKSDVIIPNVPT
jgi:hypothetical protein